MIATVVLLLTQILLSPCEFEGVQGPARCGTYSVWENRETKQGRKIDLSIIVLPALQSPAKPDPLVFFAGGPGDAPSFGVRYFSRAFANVRQTRDLVFIDPRGTGRSNPLNCPELIKPDSSGVLDADLLSLSALKACHNRLAKDFDLRQYTTEIAVDDIDEVRRALGYKQINAYGTSYGTRVAQVYMRRHPSSLRTVAMKGIVPPSMASPSTHATASEHAWQQLVKRCRADESCARNFPTLAADLETILTRLKDSPALSLPARADGPTKIQVSPELFAESFRFLLYSPEGSAQAPNQFRKWVATNGAGIAETVLTTRELFGGRLSAGFFLSVTCTEDVPYLPANATALAAKTFAGDYRLKQQTAACTVWPRGKVSKQHRSPTRSAIPTLLLSGEFDPVTPAEGGEEVLRGLSKGVHVVIRNNGHSIGNAEQCVNSMIVALIEKGSIAGLDSSCAATVAPVPFAQP